MFTDRKQHRIANALKNDSAADYGCMQSTERDYSVASTTHISTGMDEVMTMHYENDEKLIQMR